MSWVNPISVSRIHFHSQLNCDAENNRLHTHSSNYSHSYKMALSLSRLGFQQVPVTQFNLSIKLLKGKWQSVYKEIRKKNVFFKKQFKRHFQKNVSNFLSIMVQSNFNHH